MQRRSEIRLGLALLGLLLAGSVAAVEFRHHSQFGHWIGIGWHVDVISERANYQTFVPGVQHVLSARILNFTPLPNLVEACIEPNDVKPHEIPVYPFRIEKFDSSSGKWEVWPLFHRPLCLNLPIRSKWIWPLESYSTIAAPVAASDWFHKGDWIRFVALSKCDKPTEFQREVASPPFQLTEAREQ